jgi:hypothetical protein
MGNIWGKMLKTTLENGGFNGKIYENIDRSARNGFLNRKLVQKLMTCPLPCLIPGGYIFFLPRYK